jgi:methylthioribose-1-phosphate isomerase
MDRALEWVEDRVRYIDQTQLPLDTIIIETENYLEIAEDIKRLAIRGAPLIGVSAAYGIYLGIKNFSGFNKEDFINSFKTVSHTLASTRPTAVNLFWAIKEMEKTLNESIKLSIPEIKKNLLEKALYIHKDDIERCRLIGEYGNEIVPYKATIITHCNAGFLAVGGDGTALSVIYKAHSSGKDIRVYADETRPLLQGARLTAWELMNRNIDVTLIADNTAAFTMKKFKIDLAITGADRIALNGDAANKIGTYNLAIISKKHNIPFYIAAPLSTFDFCLKSGDEIPIEERAPEEVTEGFGKRIAPPGVKVYSPAFDVTPNELITGIITEKGIIYPPYSENIIKFKS